MAQRWSQRIDNQTTGSAWWGVLRFVLAALAGASVVLHLGWREPIISAQSLSTITLIAIGVYALALLIPNRMANRSLVELIRKHTFESITLGIGGLLFWLAPTAPIIAGVLALHQLFRLFEEVVTRSPSSSWVFAGTFGMLIVSGTIALKLPISTPVDKPISTVDALFTSTSAVCVTGLVVRDTGTEFTRFGQTVILAMIQLGGLGIVVFGALLALAMGSSMGLRASKTLADTTAEGLARPTTIRRLIAFITIATLCTELIGAGALYFGWPGIWEGAPVMDSSGSRLFNAVFFSISSFCNAGFATTSNSLEGLRWHWTSQIVIAGLIVIGGLGFPALDNLRTVILAKIKGKRIANGVLIRLSLHTKMVLVTTALLYLTSMLILFIGRWTQGGEPLLGALLDGHFAAITARTAGFDTVAPGSMGPLSRFTLMSYMFVGGSPGSTAGGVKTITLAILVMTIWSTMRGKTSTEAFGRTIPEELVRRAATLITLAAGLIAVLTLALAASDGGGDRLLEDLLFEVVSAFSTVGLSTGITSDLSAPGRLILVTAMFLGRVGPLVMLVALVSVGARRRPRCEFPDEMVVMS